MIISENWLKECLSSPIPPDLLKKRLTESGFEIVSYRPVSLPLEAVFVAEVISDVHHSLRLSIGGESTYLLSDNNQLSLGQKVAFSTNAHLLPGTNQPAVTPKIWSEADLGFSESQQIFTLPADAPVGALLFDYLALDDSLFEIEITPNRGDCLSVWGFAREVSAITQQDLKPQDFKIIKPTLHEQLLVDIVQKSSCPRYLGRIIKNLKTGVKTPIKVQERLRRSNIRSVSFVVDILNYVMLELGQPLHAFDLSAIDVSIVVRNAKDGETLTLLDGNSVSLSSETLVIADKHKPLAIAGVMGGADSAILPETTNIFIESAYFAPEAIAGTARFYGLNTDAAYRFERGVSPLLPRVALERATELLVAHLGGEVGEITEVSFSELLPRREKILLHLCRVNALLGIELSQDFIGATLRSLGCTVETGIGTGADSVLVVTAPMHRFDLVYPEDLMEELARLYGYTNINAVPCSFLSKVPDSQITERQLIQKARERLVALGYQEVITYSFIDSDSQKIFYPETTAPCLLNPITQEMSVMRSGLWPSLIKVMQYNQNRQQTRAKIFEIGLRFYFDASHDLIQEPVLSGLIWGSLYKEQWGLKANPADFFDVKNDICLLMNSVGRDLELMFENTSHSALHPGQSATILLDNQVVGQMGVLHPQLRLALDISDPVIVFELKLDCFKKPKPYQFKSISKFPSMRRDLAILADKNQTVSSVLAFCKRITLGTPLKQVNLFDHYMGGKLPVGKKSLGLSFVFQEDEGTLSDELVNNVMENIISQLTKELGVSLRS